MSDRYLYGKTPAEVEPADGVNGVLIRTLDGAFMFRVYHDRKRFTDYEIRHDDLNVTIDKDALAAFYEGLSARRCRSGHTDAVLAVRAGANPLPGRPAEQGRPCVDHPVLRSGMRTWAPLHAG